MQYRHFLQLIESARVRIPTVYHSTDKWYEIMNDRILRGMPASQQSREDVVLNARVGMAKKYTGWISFARSIRNSYNEEVIMGQGGVQVTLAFDYAKLKRDFTVIPVDYLQSTYASANRSDSNRRGRGESEYEERLFFTKNPPEMQIDPYITALHCMVEDPEFVEFMADWHKERVKEIEHRDLDRLMKIAKAYPNLPIYVYANEDNYLNARWAEAEQFNPNLWDHDGEDDEV